LFLVELKRRKVYRVAVVYVVVGAGIIGLGDAALPSWEQLQVPVVVLVLIGFPIALVLAWAYEVRPEEPREAEEAAAPAVETPESEQRKSIVVLPFDNMSPDPGDAYFADGLTEEIITDLSCLKSLRVISRTSAMLLKDSGKDVRTIGRELSVGYVLEGSVRKAGDRLRVTAQLIDAATDLHLWAERYDSELGDVFSIQESVARSIANALRVEVTPEEAEELSTTSVPNLAAYECVLQARHAIWTGTEDSIRKGIGYLESAQRMVGDNVAILSALGQAHFLLPHVTGEGMEDLPDRIGQIAERILSLDPKAGAGHFNKALAVAKRPGGFREAMGGFRKATELDPTDMTALIFHSFWAAQTGSVDEGLNVSDQIMSIDPLSPESYISRGYCLMFAGDLEGAVAHTERGFMFDPTSTYWRWGMTVVLAQAGQSREVARLAEEVSDAPKDNWDLSTALLGAALAGHPPEPFLVPQFLAAARHDETFSWILAGSFAQMSQVDEALSWLENAISLGFVNAEFLSEQDVLLEHLREHPRFKELIATARRESDRLRLGSPIA
jgi:TolB-like protein